jgi:hypothetical protein
MKMCPKCKLGSPDEASRCDCGYDFTTARMASSYLPLSEDGIDVANLRSAKLRAVGWLLITTIVLVGHFMCLGGLILGGWNGMLWIGLNLACMVALVSCAAHYSKCKGYDWTYGLLGIFSIAGIAILISMPYRLRSSL